MDCLKDQSIINHKMWKAAGRPRSGPVFNKYQASKRAYKTRIRECQQQETMAYTNDLHEALINKQGVSFWKCWRSKFENKTMHVTQVNGLVDNNEIVYEFQKYFKEVCSNNTVQGNTRLKNLYDSRRPSYHGLQPSYDVSFDVELIESIVCNMKRGKAAGIDDITVEHLQYCHPSIYVSLSKLFNLMIEYGIVPDEFGCSYTVPIPKSNNSATCKSLNVDDFRGISISPVMSKVFEGCILDRYSQYFCTSDNQFGFKKFLSCSHAIYSLRNVVDHYVHAGSTVNLCAMDLKKAFDKINHYGLYIKLMDRLIPSNVLSVFEYWFEICYTCVHWGKAMSGFFKLPCGVRQGGVLSPYLFAIYVNDIIEILQRSGLGCHYKNVSLCIFMYADDIILLAPSVNALQQMIYICENELELLDMVLNPKKTVCMRIGPRFNATCNNLCTGSGVNLIWVEMFRYLGVFLVSSREFRCSYDEAKKSFYRAFNAIFGKVGRLATEDVVLKLINTKCIPTLLYGLDACPVNSSDKASLEFVLNRSLMKLFQTTSMEIINECCSMFNIRRIADLIAERKKRFLLRYANGSVNQVCALFADVALLQSANL